MLLLGDTVAEYVGVVGGRHSVVGKKADRFNRCGARRHGMDAPSAASCTTATADVGVDRRWLWHYPLTDSDRHGARVTKGRVLSPHLFRLVRDRRGECAWLTDDISSRIELPMPSRSPLE